MSGIWLASYVALWAVVLLQGAAIFLLLRQIGLMYLGTAQGVATDGLPIGEKAPDFAVSDIDGRSVSLKDFRGLPLLIIFGSPNCTPCRTLIPDLNVFADERQEDLRVLFLSRGQVEEARGFAKEMDVRVPVAVHPDDALTDSFQARVTPFAFLVDGEGIIRAKGLANNREHLDLLLRMAKQEGHETAPDAGRNGSKAGEREPAEEEMR